MILTPMPTRLSLELNRKNRAEKKKRVNLLGNSKRPELNYRKQLGSLVGRLRKDVNEQIVPLLKQLQPEYVSDAYAMTLERAFDKLRLGYEDIERNAKIIAKSFSEEVNEANRQRFYNAIENAVGIDLNNVMKSEGLEDIMFATTRENVMLIKTIPSEFFKKIETVVFTSTLQGKTAGSMIEQIQNIGRVTENRARVIARDQTSKLNSALNQQRSQNLGVEEYIWRTAGDERVRNSHRSKNGKVFRWDDAPEDTGHPGQDIQCRCVAQPIIKI